MKRLRPLLRTSMNKPERELYSRLNEPKTETVNLKTEFYITNSNGEIINDPPQTFPIEGLTEAKIPLFLFNDYDLSQRHKSGIELLPIIKRPSLPGTFTYLASFFYTGKIPLLVYNDPADNEDKIITFEYTGLAGSLVTKNFGLGDYVQVFRKSSDTSLFFLVVKSENTSFQSVYKNLSNFTLINILFFSPSDRQYKNTINILKNNTFGRFEQDEILPYSYRNPSLPNNPFISIPLNATIDTQTGIYFYLYNNVSLSLTFKPKTTL